MADPKSDKEVNRKNLLNLMDLIMILTAFGPLSSEWSTICNSFNNKLIDNECQRQVQMIANTKNTTKSKVIIN